MHEIFKKIPNTEKKQFSMPLSLEIIKESSSAGIDWKILHIADLFSIIYSIRIDNAKQWLNHQRQERLAKKGITKVESATAQDFDNL